MRIAIVALLLLLVPTKALASEDVRAGQNYDLDGVDISARRGGTNQDTVGNTKNTTKTTQAEDTNTIDCWLVIPGEVGPTYDNGPCGMWNPTESVATPTFGPPAPTPAQQAQQAALEYLRTIKMPKPIPKMSAPKGICGATHSMELQIPATTTFPQEDTAFGRLNAKAVGTFTVNWGDGNKNTYNTTGAPYPNSSIDHYWENRGHYTITVTARWSVEWRLGQYSGVISGLQTSATIPDFEVIEAQAVIIR